MNVYTLNLTAADIVIHFDPWWNVAAQNQATDRAHRIGQENTVTVYELIAEHTIEEQIQKLQKSKQDLAEEILSGESISGRSLSNRSATHFSKTVSRTSGNTQNLLPFHTRSDSSAGIRIHSGPDSPASDAVAESPLAPHGQCLFQLLDPTHTEYYSNSSARNNAGSI